MHHHPFRETLSGSLYSIGPRVSDLSDTARGGLRCGLQGSFGHCRCVFSGVTGSSSSFGTVCLVALIQVSQTTSRDVCSILNDNHTFFFIRKFVLKISSALAGVAQWIEH